MLSRFRPLQVRLCCLCIALAVAAPARAADTLSLEDALALARGARAELRVAAARLDAARQRPAIVAALDDPVLAPSIDHKPLDPMMPSDRSITFEQSFPLSSVRSHRRSAAEAEVERFQAESVRTALKIQVEVAQAYFMLQERRQLRDKLAEQHAWAVQLVKLAALRHASATAPQADVLRAEMEEARLRNRMALSAAELGAAEAMFNAVLGRPSATPVPPLAPGERWTSLAPLPDLESAHLAALARRAELRINAAEMRRAQAEIKVMKSMYAPMAMVRVGRANTMTGGRGNMLMVGISLPIWFGKLDAGVREASAMAVMVDADRDAMQRMIEGEVAAAHAGLAGAIAYHQAYQSELLARAARAIGPALAAYRSGTLPLSAVVEANKALSSVQEEAVMAESALGMAWVRYRGALGELGHSK